MKEPMAVNEFQWLPWFLKCCDNAITSFNISNLSGRCQICHSDYLWRMWRKINVWGPFLEPNIAVANKYSTFMKIWVVCVTFSSVLILDWFVHHSMLMKLKWGTQKEVITILVPLTGLLLNDVVVHTHILSVISQVVPSWKYDTVHVAFPVIWFHIPSITFTVMTWNNLILSSRC